jgi:nitric oxide reductase NorE protein
MLTRLESVLAKNDETHLPGDINMWVFVLGDLVIFGVYFIVFMVYRIHERNLFLESQRHLNLTTGAVNTLVLLTSSRFVAAGVQAARANDHRRAERQISLGIVCAVVFVAIKAGEWAVEISHGHTLAQNNFFMFYFALTGIHLFHVLVGLLILAIVLYDQRTPGLRRVSFAEAGATYWHMVDVVWVAIFAVVYLMR